MAVVSHRTVVTARLLKISPHWRTRTSGAGTATYSDSSDWRSHSLGCPPTRSAARGCNSNWESNSGRSNWGKQLGEATGGSDWGKRLGEATGGSDRGTGHVCRWSCVSLRVAWLGGRGHHLGSGETRPTEDLHSRSNRAACRTWLRPLVCRSSCKCECWRIRFFRLIRIARSRILHIISLAIQNGSTARG